MVGPKAGRRSGARRLRTLRRRLVLSLLPVALAGCRSGGATLADLDGLEELKSTFNRDAGATRIVLLLSPT